MLQIVIVGILGASPQSNSRFLCTTERVFLWNVLMQAEFRHNCYGTYGVSWRHRALIILEWRQSIQVMHLNTTSCISHIVFEYTCPMIPCNCSQNVWNTEGKLLSVAIRLYTEHNFGFRSSALWCSVMGRVVTDGSKECSFEMMVNTHPKTFESRPKRADFQLHCFVKITSNVI